jgi:hypothetical protein
MAQRARTSSTDIKRFIDILNSEDVGKKRQVLRELLFDRDLVLQIPIETIERLVIDKNKGVRYGIFSNKYAIERLPKGALLKAIKLMDKADAFDALAKEQVSERFSAEELKLFVEEAIRLSISEKETYYAATLARNEDIVKRVPIKLAAKLKIIRAEYERENEKAFGSSVEDDNELDKKERVQ